ncbi:hypothetical protein vseg_002209 [Gypsophila vaccaria]
MASWGLRCLVLVLVSAVATLVPYRGTRNPDVFPAIFNFGDSNSDTGSCSAVFKHADHPNGLTFFGKPSGRFCDGRLIIDFIAEKLKLPYLSAYVDAIDANFKHGVNFAVSGTTIMPVDGKIYDREITPVPLNLQLLQFYQFKNRVEELHKQDDTAIIHGNRLPKPEDFSNALYTLDIGQNDIGLLNATSLEAYESLPDVVNRFSQSIEQLYELGARSFLIHNTGPMGCMPLCVENVPYNPKSFDQIGCSKSHNKVAQEFNRLLEAKVSLLRTQLQDSSLVYVDMYSAKYTLIRDAKQHGFVDPLGYCCKDCLKTDIPYWNRTIADLTEDVPTACEYPSKYTSWDGIHYTDAANHWLASHLFDGSINDPLLKVSQNHVVHEFLQSD